MSLVKPFAVLALAICSGLLLAGCQPSTAKAPKQPTLTAMVVTPGSANVTVGATQALNVTGGFSDGSTMNLTSTSTFASSAPTVATVSGAGVVTAVKAGAATITVRYPATGQTATASITVPQPPLVSISVTPATATVAPGATQALTVTATYSDASTAILTSGVTFATSNPAVATVNAAGVVAGIAVGTATITARDTASGNQATSAITVSGGSGGGTFTTITFDSPSVTYTLTGFGGAEDSSVVPDPTGGVNKVAKVVKSATAEVWAGTTVSTGPNQSVGKIPFDASNTRMTVRVYSPNAGIKVRLKVEDAADGTRSAETDAVTTVANAWETLTFDFANPAPGTAPLNFSYTYNKISIFFNFGVPGSATGAKTYYFDDVAFIGGTSGGGTGGFTTITFDSPTVTYTLTGFGGAEDSSVVPDPTGGVNKVAKVVKSATAEVWAGTTVSTGPNQSVGKIPFDASNTRMTVRVYSPNAGIKVRLKVEDAADGTRSAETDAMTTVANAWETLTFDFANPAPGTAPLNFSYTYNKISIFFNFGVPGSATGAKTYYFDDVAFIGGTGGGGGSGGPIVFASGYASNNRTVEMGEWGLYSGNFTSYANTYAGGGFVDGSPPVPVADSYVYLVVTTSAPTTAGYMGIFTSAPGYTTAAPNDGVTLSGQTNLKIELGMSAEWFGQPTNKQLLVRFVGAKVYSNGSGGLCQILIEKSLTPTTADLVSYTIALNSMTLAQGCNGGGFTSGVTTLAEALAKPIGEIHVQAVFPQVNTTVKAGPEYPTGFTRGSVSFE